MRQIDPDAVKDCRTLQRVIESLGVIADLSECYDIWARVSQGEWGTEWSYMGNDENSILKIVRKYIPLRKF